MRQRKRAPPHEVVEAKLEAAGYQPTLLVPAKGYWRRQDVVRWSCWARRLTDGMTVELASWDTLTDCARYPIRCIPDERYPLQIDVHCVKKRSRSED